MDKRNDPYNLNRFISAQKYDYERALQEIKAGRKRSHWIWYIFPQITGLGFSFMCKKYDITSIEEAKEYLKNELLRKRLYDICKALLIHEGKNISEIMSIDDCKLLSSMTLFNKADIDNKCNGIFQRVIDVFYDSKEDQNTIQILESQEKEKKKKKLHIKKENEKMDIEEKEKLDIKNENEKMDIEEKEKSNIKKESEKMDIEENEKLDIKREKEKVKLNIEEENEKKDIEEKVKLKIKRENEKKDIEKKENLKNQNKIIENKTNLNMKKEDKGKVNTNIRNIKNNDSLYTKIKEEKNQKENCQKIDYKNRELPSENNNKIIQNAPYERPKKIYLKKNINNPIINGANNIISDNKENPIQKPPTSTIKYSQNSSTSIRIKYKNNSQSVNDKKLKNKLAGNNQYYENNNLIYSTTDKISPRYRNNGHYAKIDKNYQNYNRQYLDQDIRKYFPRK